MLKANLFFIAIIFGLNLLLTQSSIPLMFSSNNSTNLTQKCWTAIKEKGTFLDECIRGLNRKYGKLYQPSLNDSVAMVKLVCANIKDEQDQCFGIVKV